MSILMGLFGRSKERKRPAGDRCMDCGMPKGEHTDWCPAASEARPTAAPTNVEPPTDESSGEAHPT